jgi:CPA2 family monovalent cation:H+ antiporter-2
MEPDPVFFQDLAVVVFAAAAGGALAWITRQPLILGYVLGGIVIGPFTPGPTISQSHTFELFAEIGVVLLMFSIGMEFSVKDLMRVKWVALAGGPLGILMSVGLSIGAGSLIGWPTTQSIVIGAVISVASTMVLARLLMDRGELRARHGRVMIGITLVEDLAVVAMTVLLPVIGAPELDGLVLLGQTMGKALLILAPLGLLATKVIPPLLTRVARTQNPELFLLVALAIGIGTAAITQMAGLSLALGAFVAGLIISGSDYGHEALARLLSLRDAFVAMFFVTIGALIDPHLIFDNLSLLATMLVLIMAGKLVIWTTVVRVFGYRLETALLVGIGLTQIGEFSFVLVQAARTAGHVGSDVYSATLAASLLTILLNAALVRYGTIWIGQWRVSRESHQLDAAPSDHEALDGHVVLCGFGRVGSALGKALDAFAIPYLVIERDPDIIRTLRTSGTPCLYGDASHRELLMAAGTTKARLIVVALPAIEPATLSIQRIRALNSVVPVLARAHGRTEAAKLRAVGSTEVIQPEVEASATLIRHVLGHLDQPKDRVLKYVENYRETS